MDMNVELKSIDVAPRLTDQADNVSSRYEQQFGVKPDWLVAAPGRVNLIGEHTDYNDGFVLPMAIDRYVVMAGGMASDSDDFRVYSIDFDAEERFRVDDPTGRKNGDWTNYLRGVVDGCKAEGLWAGPLNLALESAVPVGGGLSSSAALEVAMATLLEAATGKRLDKERKAYIAQKAEHDYAGVPCGIMDQFASTLCRESHLMLLDCRSAVPQMVPFSDLDISVLIINTNVKHELTGGEYAERRSQCESVARSLGIVALRDADMTQLDSIRPQLTDVLYRRARHVITENERTLRAAEAFSEGDWETAGKLMYASHFSLRDDFEVSCPELDLLVDLAHGFGADKGVYGSRMTGGGFGGCTVTLVHNDVVGTVAEEITRAYKQKTGIKPSAYVSRPSRGAHVLKADGA